MTGYRKRLCANAVCRLLKRGAFTSENDLAQQMLAFVETYNQTARPFNWTYTGKVLAA